MDYNDEYPGFTYLEAAPAEVTSISWCSNTSSSVFSSPSITQYWTLKGIGQGKTNTATMVAACTTGAAIQANNYSTATTVAGDWFLPSIFELKMMYTNLGNAGVGGFNFYSYWSSSEYSGNYAWAQDFKAGNQGNNYKYNACLVRAVRAF